MSLVVDASVFVASARGSEREHESSLGFLSLARSQGEVFYTPSLVLPECAGAMVRVTGSPETARTMVSLLEGIPQLELVPVTTELAQAAAEIAGSCRLRGSDACYAALARDRGATLITWDQEVLERGAAVATVRSPLQWMQEHS